MASLPEPRQADRVIYTPCFLLWWGLCLFLFKLGSRRQLDYELNSDGPEVLANLNRLAGSRQRGRPVNKTLDNYLGRIGAPPVAGLRQQLMQRLIRMRALDAARLQGHFVVAADGSGFLVFRQRHCEHCLTQRLPNGNTVYMHQVLEAKLLGPCGTVFSLGTEFIDNRDWAELPEGASAERRKQDCELKALRRLAQGLRKEHTQLQLCLSGDGLFACGEGFQIAKDYRTRFIYTFKEGRLPALWADFQGLLALCPQQRVELQTPEGVRQVYRWVDELPYTDSVGRNWTLKAIQCEETLKDGTKRLWAWVTDLEVNHGTVREVSTKGGRHRWHIENQGFHAQKHNGMNLEHAYSQGEHWAAYYYLLQIAHLLLQLVEKGSLLLALAHELGQASALALYGSLKNMARRLLESVRFRAWPEDAFDPAAAAHIHIRLLDSS